MIRKTAIAIAVLGLLGCAVAPVSPSLATADDYSTLKADAVYHAQEIKKLSVRQQDEIASARGDLIKFQNSAAAWENEYHDLESSFPNVLGRAICVCFLWWLGAVLVVFVVRMVATVWPGGLIGEYVAHLCNTLLAILTCFLTLLANVPDNLYFRRQLESKDRQIADLQAQLAAASLKGETA